MHAQNSLAGMLKPKGSGRSPQAGSLVPRTALSFYYRELCKQILSSRHRGLRRSGKSSPEGSGVITEGDRGLCALVLELGNQEIGSSPAFVTILRKFS